MGREKESEEFKNKHPRPFLFMHETCQCLEYFACKLNGPRKALLARTIYGLDHQALGIR